MQNQDFDYGIDGFLEECCEESDCYYCSISDADAAFWDEFYTEPTEKIKNLTLDSIFVKNETTGERHAFKGINLKPYNIVRLN